MKQFSSKIRRRRKKLLKFMSKHKLATTVSGAIIHLIFGTIIFGFVFCLNPEYVNLFFTNNQNLNRLDCIGYAFRMASSILLVAGFEIWIYLGVIKEHPNKQKLMIVYTIGSFIVAIMSYIVTRRIFMVCVAMILIGFLAWMVIYEDAIFVISITLIGILIGIILVIPIYIITELLFKIEVLIEKIKSLIKEFKEEVLN